MATPYEPGDASGRNLDKQRGSTAVRVLGTGAMIGGIGIGGRAIYKLLRGKPGLHKTALVVGTALAYAGKKTHEFGKPNTKTNF